MSDKCITYRQDVDGWRRTTFKELKIGDIIKMYNDEEDYKQGKLRGNQHWKVASEPYPHEDDTIGVVCDPIKISNEPDYNHGE